MTKTNANLLLARVGAVVAVVLATGCAELPTITVPERVNVEVPTPCVPPGGMPEKPVLTPEADLMAMDTYRRTLTVWRDLKRLEAYSAKQDAVLEQCRRLPGSSP